MISATERLAVSSMFFSKRATYIITILAATSLYLLYSCCSKAHRLCVTIDHNTYCVGYGSGTAATAASLPTPHHLMLMASPSAAHTEPISEILYGCAISLDPVLSPIQVIIHPAPSLLPESMNPRAP